jgi:hypothetical protein
MLISLDAVREFTGRVERVDGTHAALPTEVRAEYTLHEWMKCAFVGGHPHHHGFIVQLLCGPVVAIGWKCAENSITNLESIKGYLTAARTYQSDRFELAGGPETLKNAEVVANEIEHLIKLRRMLDVNPCFAAFSRAMAMRQAQGVRGTKYTWTELVPVHGTDRTRVEEREAQLHGLALWDEGIDALRLRQLVSTAMHSIPAPENLSPETAARGATALRDVKVTSVPLQRWVDDARQFFTRSNLLSAIAASGVDGLAAVEDTLVGRTGRRTALASLVIGVQDAAGGVMPRDARR